MCHWDMECFLIQFSFLQFEEHIFDLEAEWINSVKEEIKRPHFPPLQVMLIKVSCDKYELDNTYSLF